MRAQVLVGHRNSVCNGSKSSFYWHLLEIWSIHFEVYLFISIDPNKVKQENVLGLGCLVDKLILKSNFWIPGYETLANVT